MTREDLIRDAEIAATDAAAKALTLAEERDRLRAEALRIAARLRVLGEDAGWNVGEVARARSRADSARALVDDLRSATVRARHSVHDPFSWWVVVTNGPKRATFRPCGSADSRSGNIDIHPDDRHMIRCLSEAR